MKNKLLQNNERLQALEKTMIALIEEVLDNFDNLSPERLDEIERLSSELLQLTKKQLSFTEETDK